MIVAVDENFFAAYDATFADGTNFPDGSTMYRDHIIVNKTMARELGYADAGKLVGQTIIWNDGSKQLSKTVIGVVNDVNQQSLHRKVEPIVYTLKKYVYAPWAGEFYSFKIKTAEVSTTIGELEKKWKQIYAGNPFDYFFLDDYYNAQYKSDDQFGKVFMLFSGLAIFIACLGLFGLTAYMVAMRTKEIGIRKILGSSSFELVALLSRNYLLLVILAVIIGCPVSFYLVREWQSQFAYKAPITVWVFVGASMMAIVTAFLTVGIKSWKASLLDPAKALKCE
jgi:putative ABC transport system permease protein